MTDLKMEDLQEKAPASEAEKITDETVVEQDPLKTELERVQKKESRTHEEKLLFKKQQIDKEVRELGLLNDEPISEVEDDNSPVTVGMLKKFQQEAAAKTALQMTDDISDETERELVKYHLTNTIRSTGSPSEDLNLARSIVNAAKNKQIIEEVERKIPTKNYSSATSAAARQITSEPELTAEELTLMKWSGISKEQVLKSRK